MNLKETLKEVDELKERVVSAYKIADKLEDLLPEHWESRYYIDSNGLWFVNFYSRSKDPIKDFKKVCSLVNQATGQKVERSPSFIEDSLTCLSGEIRFEFKKGKFFNIKVIQYDTSKCKIEVEKKRRTIKTGKLADECLQTIGI